jgi:mannose-6-phosphate isomerase-like protein (cupin superfamily)
MNMSSVVHEWPAEASSFFHVGFLGPITLFTRAQCALIIHHLRLGTHAPPLDWAKGRAASDRFFYDLATRPVLLARLRPLLGENIILWGASIIDREPGRIHPWHTDIESSGADGNFVSVWIGLENTSQESALQLISKSHAFGKTIQQVVCEHGMRRGEASNETVLAWARTYDPLATLVQSEMTDGQAILFDGRLWHATNNTRREGRRVALLLQYAAAEASIFEPDLSQLEWPFRQTDRRPPCIVISGKDSGAVSRLVPPPAAGPPSDPIPIQLQSFPLPFTEDPGNKWRSHRFFRGTTPILEFMNCHMTVLSPGQSPHPPHTHVEEELLIVLDGEADIVLSEDPSDVRARVERLRAGSLVFHPAYQHHTIRNSHTAPVTYLMFKWQASPSEQEQPLDSKIFDFHAMLAADKSEAFNLRRVFEHPTAYLGKLHAHVSIVQPGAGYPPHADDYDVAILLLQGKLETIDQVAEPLGVIFYPAGEMHGIKNVANVPARYIVFEFHAPGQE